MRIGNVRTGLALAGLLAVMLTAVAAGPAAEASSFTYLCKGTDYSVCVKAGYTDHDYGSHSGNRYWLMDPGHNCTNYVAYVLVTVNGMPNSRPWSTAPGQGDADNWGLAESKITDGTPAVGSVAWWNKADGQAAGMGDDGHVAYVESYTSTSITVSEDAFPDGPFNWVRIPTTSSRYPTGFIHFKDIQPPPPASHFVPFAGDFNGDGIDDLGLWRISSGTFYIRYGPSYTTQVTYVWASGSNFEPLVGDFNGDGIEDIALRKISTGMFYFRYGPNYETQTSYTWASTANFEPITGDFNGDGIDDIALRKISTGTFYVRYGPSYDTQTSYTWASTANFEPFATDIDSDGIDDLGLWKVSTGTFYVRYGPNHEQFEYVWTGGINFQPLTGDFNGDGIDDLALRKTSTGTFYMRYGPNYDTQTSYTWAAG